ncbi:MAG TPA: hypothetical protein VMT17_15660 [Anaeromyxobacteraceae bacterium]|nr:hypothetical protein [Anaeromyxobacteraceae bacterium]
MRTAALAIAAALCFRAGVSQAAEPVSAPATTSAGAPAPCAPEEKSHRELGGHFFMPSHLTTEPFSYTSFGTFFGLGAGQALGPTVDWSTSPPTVGPSKWYAYNSLAQQFQLDVRIIEYLSLGLAASGYVYTGSGADAIIAVGSGVNLSGTFAVKGSLPIGDRVRLSLALSAQYGPVFNVLLAQGIRDIITNCEKGNCPVNLGSFLQQNDTVTWGATLTGAWAPWAFLGVNLNLSYLNPRKTGTASVSENGLYFAGTLDFDAKPLVRWLPVGVNFGYALTSPIGGNGTATTQDWEFGFYYTGRKDMSVGLELDWKSGRLNSEQIQNSTTAWINFKYYW